MSFQYGSDSPEINNPFKQEGLLYLIGGGVIMIVGFISLLTLRGQIVENGIIAGWLGLIVALILLTGGILYLSKGLFKVSRFYVGRGVPASLSNNVAQSEKETQESKVYYQSNGIEQMLMGRKNLTFQEPATMFDRLVYSIFPNFIFLPISMRNYIHILIRNTGYSLIALLAYLLSVLSGTIGLTLLTQSSFSRWLGIAVCIFLLVLWLGSPISTTKTRGNLQLGKNSQLAWVIALAILIPAIAEFALRNGVVFPDAPVNPVFALIAFLILIGLVCVAGLTLAKLRADLASPITEVSESIDHWQENVHPKDFFRALDLEMADLRYKEIPNRVYRELNPNLNMEGSMDKGSFKGDTIQETQPIYQEIKYPEILKKLRLGIAAGGQFLVITAAFLLFFINQSGADIMSFNNLFPGVFFPGILLVAGTSLLTFAHLYWGEMQFKSYLVQFQGEGTYTESKFSVGMAITDSTRSENTVVRSSFSTWFLVTETITSTQARSGRNTLDGARYILSMNKSDQLLNHLVDQVSGFLEDRQLVASSTSEKDGNAIKALYATNEAAPALGRFPNREQKELAGSHRQQEEEEQLD